MEYRALIQKSPWLKGLIWGWFMFVVLTGIDYHNGELPPGEIQRRFFIWTGAGLVYGYLRAYFLERKD